MIKHPFEMRSEKAGDTVHIVHENEVRDVQRAIVGLTKIFKVKMYTLPSTHAIRAYKLLVSHLIAHYKKPVVFGNTSTIRYIVSFSLALPTHAITETEIFLIWLILYKSGTKLIALCAQISL